MKRLLFVVALLCLAPLPAFAGEKDCLYRHTPRDAPFENWKKMFAYESASRLVEAIPGLIGGGNYSPRAGYCSFSGSYEQCTSCCMSEDGFGDVLLAGAVAITAGIFFPAAVPEAGLIGAAAAWLTDPQSCLDSYCEGLLGDSSVTTCGYNGTGICSYFVSSCWIGEPDPVCVSPLQCWCNDPPPDDDDDDDDDCDPVLDPCCLDPQNPCCVDPWSPSCV